MGSLMISTSRGAFGLLAAMWLVLTASATAVTAADSTMSPSRLEAVLETHQGKVVLVDYWATWCPPCRMAAPELDALYRSLQVEGLEIVGVSFDRDEKPVQKFIARYELSYPIYIGTAGLKQLKNVSVLPTTVLIARDGSVAGRYIGYLPQETLEEKIRVLLAQES